MPEGDTLIPENHAISSIYSQYLINPAYSFQIPFTIQAILT